MHADGIIDATFEEALGSLLQEVYEHKPWLLYEVFAWAISYLDYRSGDTELLPEPFMERLSREADKPAPARSAASNPNA